MAIRLAIVGCGGMGHRHLRGLGQLRAAGISSLELVAACDPVAANAASLAGQAEVVLGTRPAVVAALGDLRDHGVQAVAITSTPRTHHLLAVDALRRGLHVLIEKPMALTVAACLRIRSAAGAAAGTEAVLSVAENYRRDPTCRLAKALLDAGVIGTPRLVVQHRIGGGDRMGISLWRHQREHGGLLLDVGVHFADVLEYLLGRIDTAYAVTRLHEPVRRNPAAGAGGTAVDPANAYRQWQRVMPVEFEATAEDALYGTLTFASGAVGSIIQDHAGHGIGLGGRAVFGSTGSMTLPGDRSGDEIAVHYDGGERLEGEALLEQVPEFRLDANTAALFGAERLWRYDHPFPVADAKLLAVEYAELADAIQSGASPEIDAEQGMRAVASYYALLESAASGVPVRVRDVLDGRVDACQRALNDSLGLPPDTADQESVRLD